MRHIGREGGDGSAQRDWLAGWSLTSLFSTNTTISETKRQGWKLKINAKTQI